MALAGSETDDSIRALATLMTRLERLADTSDAADRKIIISALCFLQHGSDLLAEIDPAEA